MRYVGLALRETSIEEVPKKLQWGGDEKGMVGDVRIAQELHQPSNLTESGGGEK